MVFLFIVLLIWYAGGQLETETGAGGGTERKKQRSSEKKKGTKKQRSSQNKKGIFGSCSEFPCEYPISLTKLTQHILDTSPDLVHVHLPPNSTDFFPAPLQRYRTSLGGASVLTPLSRRAKTLEHHFEKHVKPNLGVFGHDPAVFNNKSTTAMFRRFYNLFALDEPAIGQLYWAVKRAFHDYYVRARLPRASYLIHGWFTCFRAGELGQDMPFHVHGRNQISGNLLLEDSTCGGTQYVARSSEQDTFGFIIDATDVSSHSSAGQRKTVHMPFGDNIGTLTFFRGDTPHRVTSEWGKHNPACDAWWAENCCRTGLAFDIADANSMPSLFHAVPLYDPDNPEWHKLSLLSRFTSSLQNNLVSLQRNSGMSGSISDLASFQANLNILESMLDSAKPPPKKQRSTIGDKEL